MENLTGTIFRKVSVKEKLPTGEGFMRLLVWDKNGIDIWDDYDPNEFDDEATLKQHYTHWLEEIKLPTEFQINNMKMLLSHKWNNNCAVKSNHESTLCFR